MRTVPSLSVFLLSIFLSVVLISPARAVSVATPSASPVAPGTVLFAQTTWPGDHPGWTGPDGKTFPAGWAVANGNLVNDGTGNGALLTAPYRPKSNVEYAIETEIRLDEPANACHFGLR